MEEGKKRGGALAALLAVGALGLAAVPAYGALSDGSGSNGSGGATQQSAPGFVQGEERGQPPGNDQDKDCPWKDGGGDGGDANPGGSGGGSQEGVSSDSASLY